MPKTRKTSSPAARRSPSAGSHPTREQIALRAYEIYLERGCAPGRELEDWTQAERELVEKNGKPRRKASAKSIAA
ncbi:MAG TPA: DUF2934 domain-containing protein [Methylomirabilota bacterium]|nr:DUF2934 domain-containing protein [Methylomirabilota bacterium]